MLTTFTENKLRGPVGPVGATGNHMAELVKKSSLCLSGYSFDG